MEAEKCIRRQGNQDFAVGDLGAEIARLNSFEDGRGRYGGVGRNGCGAGNVVRRLRLTVGAAGQHSQQVPAIGTFGSHLQKRNRFKMNTLK